MMLIAPVVSLMTRVNAAAISPQRTHFPVFSIKVFISIPFSFWLVVLSDRTTRRGRFSDPPRTKKSSAALNYLAKKISFFPGQLLSMPTEGMHHENLAEKGIQAFKTSILFYGQIAVSLAEAACLCPIGECPT